MRDSSKLKNNYDFKYLECINKAECIDYIDKDNKKKYKIIAFSDEVLFFFKIILLKILI